MTFHLWVVAVGDIPLGVELHMPAQVVAVDRRWAGLHMGAGLELKTHFSLTHPPMTAFPFVLRRLNTLLEEYTTFMKYLL